MKAKDLTKDKKIVWQGIRGEVSAVIAHNGSVTVEMIVNDKKCYFKCSKDLEIEII